MSGWHLVLVLVAGLAAGTVNAVAGGGTLLTYPALLAAGLSPVAANVTNTVAVWPGYVSSAVGLREDSLSVRLRFRLAVAAVVGAILGTVVLLTTPAGVFRAVVPYLVLAATALLAVQPRISRFLAGRRTEMRSEAQDSRWLPAGMFVVAVYGAYFGGGLGIVLLAVLALGVPIELGRLSAAKAWLQLVVNSVALIGFAVFGPVHWWAALAVAPASFLGGLLGARIVRRLDARTLRTAVVVFGVGAGIALLLKG